MYGQTTFSKWTFGLFLVWCYYKWFCYEHSYKYFVWICFILLRYKHRSGIIGSYTTSRFKFLRNYQVFFKMNIPFFTCTNIIGRFRFATSSSTFVIDNACIITILGDGKLSITVVWICTFLIAMALLVSFHGLTGHLF